MTLDLNVRLQRFPSVNSWSELYENYLKHFHSATSRGLWVFRGQSDFEWDLRTSLQRATSRIVDTSDLRFFEEGIVREFQRRVRTADDQGAFPHPDNILGWMSLMQHHGAPTRLLDWTYSFFVALFFAIDSSEKDAAVYAIDARWCNARARQQLEKEGLLRCGEDPKLDDPYIGRVETFEKMFANEVLLVYRINPFSLNTRLAVQQGLFLCPGSVVGSFEQNLLALCDPPPSSPPIYKIKIPKRIHTEVLKHLGYMNIGRHSLFPGMDGLAQSLRHSLLLPERLYPEWRKKRKTKPFDRWL